MRRSRRSRTVRGIHRCGTCPSGWENPRKRLVVFSFDSLHFIIAAGHGVMSGQGRPLGSASLERESEKWRLVWMRLASHCAWPAGSASFPGQAEPSRRASDQGFGGRFWRRLRRARRSLSRPRHFLRSLGTPRDRHGIGGGDWQCGADLVTREWATVQRAVGKSGLCAVSEGGERLRLGIVFGGGASQGILR